MKPIDRELMLNAMRSAAMIFLARVKDPVRALMALDSSKWQRKTF